MRRQTVLLIALVLSLLILGTVPAAADVHLVAQAGCAPAGVESGAIGSRHAIESGRPAAPIMVSASPWSAAEFPGAVNSQADPQGTNC